MVLTPRFIAKSVVAAMPANAVAPQRPAAQAKPAPARVLQSGAAPAQLSFFFKRG